MSKGIDYSGPAGTCNRDPKTGIRYGILPVHSTGDGGGYWWNESEPDYGPPTCPECGNETRKSKGEEDGEYYCEVCQKGWESEDSWGDEPVTPGILENSELSAFSDDSGDLWVTKSIYYTRAQFCSPCAPGACYLLNDCPDGERAYCLGHEWFDGGQAPYPVYRVEDDSEVESVPK